MLYEKFCKSKFCEKVQGDGILGAAALYIMPAVKDAGLTEEDAFLLAGRAYDVILADEPRFTGIDLAEALLNRHTDKLADILRFGDEAFSKVAILDAQRCREVWSQNTEVLFDDVDEVIATEMAALKETESGG